MIRTRFAVLLLLAGLFVSAAQAQHDSAARQALESLRADVRARVLMPGDSLLALPTIRREHDRIDARTGIVRADYRVQARLTSPPSDAEGAARRYLAAHAARYGLAGDLADLEATRVVSGAYSHHVTFTQTVDGVPVYGRAVQVNLDRHRQPLMVLSAYDPALRGVRLEAERLSAADAAAAVRGFLAGGRILSAPERVVMPAPNPRRAWRVMGVAQGIEWEFVVDAATGEALVAIERSTHGLHGTGRGNPGAPEAAQPFGAALFPFFDAPSAASVAARADGLGLVFDPDPLTTAGVPYAGPYTDNNDADTPELNAERRPVVLRDLTLNGGRYTLSGPFVRIVGDPPPGGVAYTPPQEPRPDGFQYTRAHDGFEAVMAYYHADAAQRHVQALDVGRPVHAVPQRINPQGFGPAVDDSRFYPTSGLIAFGQGAVDDAEDADVIWHEYAHALLHASQPALYQASDGTALHEGWADYWAGSHRRALIEAGAGSGDWRRLFPWDGNSGCWQGRRLDHQGRYPDQTAYPAVPGCGPLGTIYQRGLLWATTLMEIHDALGRHVTDRLNVASHAFLGAVTSAPAFEVAAEALLAADQAIYAGQHRGVLLQVLGARGYVDPTTYGPTIEHTPLASTEQSGGTREVMVTARSASASIVAVEIRYQVDGGEEQTVGLAPQGGDVYTGALPLPTAPATITYYVDARDALGRATRLPAAPAERFSFTAGPDRVAPEVAHTARERLPLAAWPGEISATVTDNLGVDTVKVVYEVIGPGGALVATGAFGLSPTGDDFRGVWPVPASLLEIGSRVRYRIEARDAALQPNTAVLPASGWFEIEIVARGVIAHFDFEAGAGGITADGVWTRGRPQYGLQRAHTGTAVWMTVPGGAYPGTRSASYLYLPGFDLRGDAPYLVFWHWYDTEQDATCQTLCDGGIVEVSTDGGATWEAARPEDGYPAMVGAVTSTELAGREAWGGYSYGWQRAIVPLPPLPDVRVRFVFATDAGNVYPSRYGYAGWALDDVQITTLLPEDGLPPFVEVLPPAVEVQPAGAQPAPFVVEVRDETGVARAEVRYAFTHGAITTADTLRLEQLPAGLTRFSGTITLPQVPAAGDRLAYTLYLEDANGNAISYPETSAFETHFRTLAQQNVLAGARGTGLWQRQGGAWTVGVDVAAYSALVFPPQDLPANAESITFRLRHRYWLSRGAGGNAKLSTDGGATWRLLTPAGGYPATLEASGHPMDGEAVFAGPPDTLDTSFDLTPFAGMQIRLRLDVAARPPLAPGEGWTVDAATRYDVSAEDVFETPRTFALHPAQPTPFRTATTLTYTLDEPAEVQLAVYDVLGRRVAMLVAGAAQPAGTYTVPFDGTGFGGGVYLVRLQAGRKAATAQIVLVR